MPNVFPDLKRYDKIGLDTETTGLTFEDRAVGVSIAVPDGQSWYLRWGHEQGGNNCTLAQVIRWAKAELQDNDRHIAMHNAVFDLRMMRKVGIKVKGQVHDSGIMAALLNEYEPDFSLDGLSKKYLDLEKKGDPLYQALAKLFGGQPTRNAQGGNIWRASGDLVEEYAKFDAVLAMKLVDHFWPDITKYELDRVYLCERRIIPVLVDMYFAGVKIDVKRAEQTKRQLVKEHEALNKEWDKTYGIDYTIKKDLIALFDKEGIKYPMTKPSKRFPNGQPSITKDLLEEIDHPVGDHLRGMRQVKHYAGTFINNYLLDNVDSQGVIHPQFHSVKSTYGGTITGRFSSAGGLNAQNIPARDERWAPVIRGLFIPWSDDHQWMKCDYSQIEYRFFAHYAGGQLRDAYINNPLVDFHDMVAEMTGLPRKAAKNINFGILYGMGEKKTAVKLGVSLAEAKKLLKAYNVRVPEAKDLYNQAMNRGNRRGYIRTWGGRLSRFQKTPNGRGFMGTHKALNKLLQGSAADLIKYAMAEVHPLLDWEDRIMHLTVHDELDFSIPKGDAGLRFAKDVKDVMQSFKIDVPIMCEPELGPDWGHTEKIAV